MTVNAKNILSAMFQSRCDSAERYCAQDALSDICIRTSFLEGLMDGLMEGCMDPWMDDKRF